MAEDKERNTAKVESTGDVNVGGDIVGRDKITSHTTINSFFNTVVRDLGDKPLVRVLVAAVVVIAVAAVLGVLALVVNNNTLVRLVAAPTGTTTHPTPTSTPEASSQPVVTFGSVALMSSNPDWFEVPEDTWGVFYDFGVKPALYLETARASDIAAPSFDVTVLNLSENPLLVTDVGVEITEIINIIRGGGGSIPSSAEVEIAGAHALKMPDYRERFGYDALWPGEELPHHLDEIVSVKLANPVYMQAQAPFRYTLILGSYSPNLPTDVLLRMWCRTNAGEAKSQYVQLQRAP